MAPKALLWTIRSIILMLRRIYMIQGNGSVISEVKIHFLMSIKILLYTLHIRDIGYLKKKANTQKSKHTFLLQIKVHI